MNAATLTRQIICGAGKVLQAPRGAVYCVSQRAEQVWEGVSSATTRSHVRNPGNRRPGLRSVVPLACGFFMQTYMFCTIFLTVNIAAGAKNSSYRHKHAVEVSKRASRRPPAIAVAWAVPFTLVLTVLLVDNAFLFSTPEHENSDMAANSILIEQARRFTLLVGNYSREKFNHPGPAFLYVQSWGESLFYDALHVVPTPWNGQLIALYALNAFFAASVVAVVYGWTRSLRGAAVALAVVLLFAALHPAIFSSDWMPYVYVPAYLAFVVAIASVAAGRTEHAWLAALTGWFLINGHACFLVFVPALSATALAALLWERRASLTGPSRRWPRPRRRVWAPVAVISAVLALPIIVELVLHWPGNFGKYFAYSSSSDAGGHSVKLVVEYTLWYWWPHHHAWAVPLILVTIATLLAWRLPAGQLRRLCFSLLVVDAVSTAVLLCYVAGGVDWINNYYIGYFYWSAPVLVVLVIGLSAADLLASVAAGRGALASTVVAAVAVLAAGAAWAISPETAVSTVHVDPENLTSNSPTDPGLPGAVAAMAKVADGRPAVLHFQQDAWPTLIGLLVQSERAGVTACVTNQSIEYMITSEFMCTSAQVADGRILDVYATGQVPRGATVVYRLRWGVVTEGGGR